MRPRDFFRLALAGAVAGFAATAVLWADVAFSRADAASFRRKLAIIGLNSTTKASTPRHTPVREGEVNAYLRFDVRDQMPDGLMEPYISIVGDGRVAGRAIVDLDVVRQKRASGGWLDPMSYLTGRLPVRATGLLRTANGVGRLEIEAVEIAGVSVPVSFLQELVSFYSRTPENPDGVALNDPFDLPAEIREIRVGQGEAVVVQ